MLTNKRLGTGMMIAASVLFVIGFFYIRQSESFLLSQAKTGPEGECIHTGTVCPYEQLNELSVPKFLGLFAILLFFAGGAYLFLKKTPQEAAAGKARKHAKNLGAEETKIFDLITAAEGMIFQNELVEKSQLSKVKITRILDKLEAKGLVERRRRGMTNVVILKQ